MFSHLQWSFRIIAILCNQLHGYPLSQKVILDCFHKHIPQQIVQRCEILISWLSLLFLEITLASFLRFVKVFSAFYTSFELHSFSIIRLMVHSDVVVFPIVRQDFYKRHEWLFLKYDTTYTSVIKKLLNLK